MGAKILEGKVLADSLLNALRLRVNAHTEAGKRPPCLAVIMIGNDPASALYVNHKLEACRLTGINSKPLLYDYMSEPELVSHIKKLNNDPNIDGILVQLPLPSNIDKHTIVEAISPQKDVDGFHPYNLGKLCQQASGFRPCTPLGIMKLLEHTGVDLRGLHATVIGSSTIVGRPMSLELLTSGCTVTICHRLTQNLQSFVESADILVAAAGQPELVPGLWIKPGAIVIDVGINRLKNGKLLGDVQFEVAKERASWITPVPGGVGPMTVAMLLSNTLRAYENA